MKIDKNKILTTSHKNGLNKETHNLKHEAKDTFIKSPKKQVSFKIPNIPAHSSIINCQSALMSSFLALISGPVNSISSSLFNIDFIEIKTIPTTKIYNMGEVFLLYPKLKLFEGILRVEHFELPLIKGHVRDLALLPKAVIKKLVNSGLCDIHIANKTVPWLDSNKKLKGKHPRGWSKGKTLNVVPGAFSPNFNSICAGKGEHASSSLILHETGHAIGSLLGYYNHPSLIADHKRLFNKLSPYYQQEGPGGEAGREELLAESIAVFLKYGKKKAIKEYDKKYIQFIENVVLA